VSKNASSVGWQSRTSAAVHWLNILLLVGVPLSFSTAVYNLYSLPKFALLLPVAAALVPLLTWIAINADRHELKWRFLASRQVSLVSLYLVAISISTLFGVAPVASLFGTSYNRMGLLTQLCFFMLFISLIAATGTSEKRLRNVLWAMALTGLVVATYAYLQFFGYDPFLSREFYTFESKAGAVVRVHSTLGHSNYLGNFLLYTAPVCAGLAFASSGRARRIAFMALAVSVAAIVFTGTRGAWVGLVVGATVFVTLQLLGGFGKLLKAPSRPMIRRAGLASIVVLVLIGLISLSPASRNIALRARSLIEEGFTGSGRTILWRDSLKMVTRYALVGCGPEGFRTAFLPFKSIDLSRLAPGTNNESSHNSYIDAAVSYGLPGAILYVAIIASSFALLRDARRRVADKRLKVILVSLMTSMAAVVTHNFFIFDQISTGLYFFAFAALAQVASSTTTTLEVPNGKAPARKSDGVAREVRRKASTAAYTTAKQVNESPRQLSSPTIVYRLAPLLVVAGCVLFIAAVWHSVEISRADMAIKRALISADTGDLDAVVEHGNRALSSSDPTGNYHLLLARSLALCADRLATDQSAKRRVQSKPDRQDVTRNQAINLAMSHAERSLVHTLAPESSYVLLAYLALQLGDADKVFAYASEAVRLDPNFSNSHWLMAEALLAKGERKEAAGEARVAMDLSPHSREARSAFKRAGGMPLSAERVEELIRHGRALANQGMTDAARRLILRALHRSDGPCADCHSALASLYETENRYEEAIAEWEAFAREAPERAMAERISSRVEMLKQRASQKP
jgi:O-antigen ligase/tetratricopeptide (TPR) repeat protein